MVSKLWKYDPGCSSRIRMLTVYPSRIPDPGVKKAPDPGFRIRNTGHQNIFLALIQSSDILHYLIFFVGVVGAIILRILKMLDRILKFSGKSIVWLYKILMS
jgi:hypothetical protein